MGNLNNFDRQLTKHNLYSRSLPHSNILLIQGESLWLHLDTIKELTRMCRSIFEGGDVRYAYTTIPTYPRY